MNGIILAAVLAAGDFSVDVENVRNRSGAVTAVFKLTNNTPSAYKSVFVNCVFFDNGNKAVSIGHGIVNNVHPMSKNYGDASIVLQPGETAKAVSCSVTEILD